MMQFDAQKTSDGILQWIRAWFDTNGPGCPAVVGISGGKDSSTVAALCVRALGRERVIGVLMPDGVQADIADSYWLCEHLGIRALTLPIHPAVSSVHASLKDAGVPMNRQATLNLPARVRMTTLYAASQALNGRVANTCNLSEDWIGYSTRYGDSAGDFCPIARLTVTEVRAIGACLGLPEQLVYKTPSDGLSGLSDEANLGFSYAVLDEYIRTGVCSDREVQARIDHLHQMNRFKLQMPPCYEAPLPILAADASPSRFPAGGAGNLQ